MAENFPLIGRQKEIKIIEKKLFDWGTTQLIGIYSDDGGIGKTRLMQELFAKYANSEYSERDLLVVPIIDFDDRSVSSRGTLLRKIVSELGDEKFTSYLRRMIDWRKVEAAGVSHQRLDEESTIVRKEFQNCLNQISISKRIIFLLDTAERVETNEIWDFLASMLAESQNIVVIMSGRNVNNIYQELFPTSKGKFRKSLIRLLPFEPADSDHYLKVKLASINHAFHAETISKIKLLSGGIPILLDLAIERLAQDDQFAKFLALKPPSFFENLSSKNRSESEKIMVGYLIDQRTDLVELILLLAHVYPVNKNMLQDMLQLEASKVDILLQKTVRKVYIKNLPGGRISLHDEMRRMVNEYVWPVCDVDNNLRKQYSKKAVDFFERDISYLDKQIAEIELHKAVNSLERSVELDNFRRHKDNAQTEYLRHLLIVDINKGMEYYLKNAEDARKSYRLRFAQKMGSYVAKIEHISGEYKYKVELMRIKLLMDNSSRNAMQAKEALQLLLDEAIAVSDKSKRNEIINLMGRCEVLMGNYKEALAYEEEVLRYYTDPDDIVIVLNYVGYICRLMGDWRKATSYYKKALNVAQGSSSISQNTIASIYNNLAYAVCLLGNYGEAKSYCLEAIRIWEKKGTASLIGRGYLTRAIIYRDRGKYSDASSYFKRAIEIFEKLNEPDDYKYLAGAYFDYAWSLWFEGDVSTYDGNSKKNKELYENSKNYFDRAKEIAEKYEVISFLPGIFNQMTNIYWRLGMKQEARLFLDQAYELSKRYNDIRYQIDSLLGFAEFDSDEGIYDNIDIYAAELKAKYEDQGFEFPLFYGRMKRIRAESALIKKDFTHARELFAEGLAQISQHGGYGVYFLDRELDRLKAMMIKNLGSTTIIEWTNFFQNYWLTNASQKEEKIGTFVGWCSTFINQTKFD